MSPVTVSVPGLAPGATVPPVLTVTGPTSSPVPPTRPRPAAAVAGPRTRPTALRVAAVSTNTLCVKSLVSDTSAPPALLLTAFRPTGKALFQSTPAGTTNVAPAGAGVRD